MGAAPEKIEVPRKCYNAHDHYELGWFASHAYELDPVQLLGQAEPKWMWVAAFVDYDQIQHLSPPSNHTNNDPMIQDFFYVVIKIGDLYVQYNRATKFNVETEEFPNTLTVIRGESDRTHLLAGLQRDDSERTFNVAMSSGPEGSTHMDITLRVCASHVATTGATDDADRLLIRIGLPGQALIACPVSFDDDVSLTVPPTSLPSSAPISTPTNVPTFASSAPTPTPSLNPSKGPTRQPSADPSWSPSTIPTMTPSLTASLHPSAQPTQQPSSSPSADPSGSPSTIPTMTPSPTASLNPSAQPTQQPSSSPSADPSGSPSTIPTMTQSPTASLNPSAQPTQQPSSSPSVDPSGSPSTIPTMTQSPTASLNPSAGPTQQPSSSPSADPSGSPSPIPTVTPSLRPTLSQEPTGTATTTTTATSSATIFSDTRSAPPSVNVDSIQSSSSDANSVATTDDTSPSVAPTASWSPTSIVLDTADITNTISTTASSHQHNSHRKRAALTGILVTGGLLLALVPLVVIFWIRPFRAGPQHKDQTLFGNKWKKGGAEAQRSILTSSPNRRSTPDRLSTRSLSSTSTDLSNTLDLSEFFTIGVFQSIFAQDPDTAATAQTPFTYGEETEGSEVDMNEVPSFNLFDHEDSSGFEIRKPSSSILSISTATTDEGLDRDTHRSPIDPPAFVVRDDDTLFAHSSDWVIT